MSSSSSSSPTTGDIDEKLRQLGLELPPTPKAAANYQPCQRAGDLLYLAGHLPLQNDGSLLHAGKLGADKTVEEGYEAARQVALNLLSTIRNEVDGDWDQVVQIVKLFGIVQSADDFHQQHLVLNGASDLFGQVFGPERGRHSRSAIGTNTLPLGTCVEIEAIVQVKAK